MDESAPYEGLRVLHVLGGLNPSGMERMLMSAAAYFEQLNVDTFVFGQGGIDTYAQALTSVGYKVHVSSCTMRSRTGRQTLRKFIFDNRIDVVNIHTEANYLLTVISCITARKRIRIVRTIHSIFDAHGRWFLSRLLQALVADRLVGAIIAPTKAVQENERRFGRIATIICNWVDDRFYKIRDERAKRGSGACISSRKIALVVGNCSDLKRHELALQAVLALDHDVIHIGSEFAANKAELLALRELHSAGKLLDRGVKDPDDALLRADYFLMPSRVEGMGVALAEAIVAGLPAVISRAPGLEWAHGAQGVVESDATIEDWSAAIRRLPPSYAAIDIDLSARRGAGEYAGVYREQQVTLFSKLFVSLR